LVLDSLGDFATQLELALYSFVNTLDLGVDVSHDSLDDGHVVSELTLESHRTAHRLENNQRLKLFAHPALVLELC
jgi:hypothetical protein